MGNTLSFLYKSQDHPGETLIYCDHTVRYIEIDRFGSFKDKQVVISINSEKQEYNIPIKNIVKIFHDDFAIMDLVDGYNVKEFTKCTKCDYVETTTVDAKFCRGCGGELETTSKIHYDLPVEVPLTTEEPEPTSQLKEEIILLQSKIQEQGYKITRLHELNNDLLNRNTILRNDNQNLKKRIDSDSDRLLGKDGTIYDLQNKISELQDTKLQLEKRSTHQIYQLQTLHEELKLKESKIKELARVEEIEVLKEKLQEKSTAIKKHCNNCKYEDYNINNEPCHNCCNHENWEPIPKKPEARDCRTCKYIDDSVFGKSCDNCTDSSHWEPYPYSSKITDIVKDHKCKACELWRVKTDNTPCNNCYDIPNHPIWTLREDFQ